MVLASCYDGVVTCHGVAFMLLQWTIIIIMTCLHHCEEPIVGGAFFQG
jgi:hypothetical protein